MSISADLSESQNLPYKCVVNFKYHSEILILNDVFTFQNLKQKIQRWWMINKNEYSLTNIHGVKYSSFFDTRREYYLTSIKQWGEQKNLDFMYIYVKLKQETMDKYETHCSKILDTKVY